MWSVARSVYFAKLLLPIAAKRARSNGGLILGRRFGGTSFFAALGSSARKNVTQKRRRKFQKLVPKTCPEKCLVLCSCLKFSGQVFGISFRRDKQHFRARFRDNIFSGQRVCFFGPATARKNRDKIWSENFGGSHSNCSSLRRSQVAPMSQKWGMRFLDAV